MSYTSDIEVGKVSQAGIDVRTNAGKMYQSLSRIRQLVKESSSYFDSQAGAEIRTKFEQSAAEFENFKTFLNQYGEFLETHAKNVNAFEAAVEEGLSQIPQL